MKNRFLSNLRESIDYRKRAMLPNVKVIIIAAVAFTLVYILISIYFVPARKSTGYNFTSENGSITAMSALFLAMAGSFSLASLAVNISNKARPIWMWAVMAAGFGFLNLDELLMFHERLGSTIKDYVDSGIFRNWNDVIVILYGILALPLVAAFLPGIIRYRMFLELLVTAFVFYAIHTLIDATQSPRTAVSATFEESAKLLSVTFLALAAFIGFLGTLWNSVPATPEQSNDDALLTKTPIQKNK